jgi:hypothetical protein
LLRWIESRLQEITEVPVPPNLRKTYGLGNDEEFERWCKENELAFTAPMFEGLSYVIHRTRYRSNARR